MWVPVRRLTGPRQRWYNSLPFHFALFLLTVLTTLVVGTHIALNYAHNIPVFDWDVFPGVLSRLMAPSGVASLGCSIFLHALSILLAHELGHYFTCRHYGIRATYPYFIPAPTLIGTLGAFIRIKSPIVNRRELFDVGISGPLAGFVLAIPALILATFLAKGTMPAATPDSISLGSPAGRDSACQAFQERDQSGGNHSPSRGLRRLGGLVCHRLEPAPSGPARWRPHPLRRAGRQVPEHFTRLFSGVAPPGIFLLVRLAGLGSDPVLSGPSPPDGG